MPDDYQTDAEKVQYASALVADIDASLYNGQVAELQSRASDVLDDLAVELERVDTG